MRARGRCRRRAIDLRPHDVAELVLAELSEVSGRYLPTVKRNADLLFYVNKVDHWFEMGQMPSASCFAPFGWRSVSALVASQVSMGSQADESAPSFLREDVGQVRERHEPL